MEEISYEKLHEQYKSADSPSVQGQIAWLQKKGIPLEHIQSAMMHVYGELARKEKVFKDTTIPDGGEGHVYSAGAQLDHYLLSHAKRVHDDGLRNIVGQMEKNHNALINASFGKLGWRKRLKALFTGKVA
jgi:hypothetical protein